MRYKLEDTHAGGEEERKKDKSKVIVSSKWNTIDPDSSEVTALFTDVKGESFTERSGGTKEPLSITKDEETRKHLRHLEVFPAIDDK